MNIGFWNLSGVIADKYFHDNVVLCGDAAHSFPPAGGFGMNTGIQDAYNLAYKLAYMMKHNLSEEEYTQILKKYSDERRSHAQFNLSTAMRYYGNSLRIANYLGEYIDYILINCYDQVLKSKILNYSKELWVHLTISYQVELNRNYLN